MNYDGVVSTSDFVVENEYDKLRVNNKIYSGSTGPSNEMVSSGDVVRWTSDYNHVRTGWNLCFSPTGSTTASTGSGSGSSTSSSPEPASATITNAAQYTYGYGAVAMPGALRWNNQSADRKTPYLYFYRPTGIIPLTPHIPPVAHTF